MQGDDYLASITLSHPSDEMLNPQLKRHELMMLAALAGPVPITQAEEEQMLEWMEKGLINPHLRLTARIMRIDDNAKPPMGTLWCDYQGCKLSHLLLAFAKRSPHVMQKFIEHYVDPSSIEFRPFWFRNDGLMLPGRYANVENLHKTFSDVREIASDICWPLLVEDARTPLHTTGIPFTQTVTDSYAHSIICHLGFMPADTVELLPTYTRFMKLMSINAPLNHYADNAILSNWMRSISAPDWQRFSAMKPTDDSSWITPLIFRQWSLAGRLEEVLSSDYWTGKEDQAIALATALPENEQEPATNQIIQLYQRLDATTRPRSSWCHLVSRSSTDPGIKR